MRVVAPYLVSLLKLMVPVGRGLTTWPAALEPMIVVSDHGAICPAGPEA